jgi:hypothetical protein
VFEAGVDLLTISRLLGHASFATTMIYLHCRREHLHSAPSPLDWLPVKQLPTYQLPSENQTTHAGESTANSESTTSAEQPTAAKLSTASRNLQAVISTIQFITAISGTVIGLFLWRCREMIPSRDKSALKVPEDCIQRMQSQQCKLNPSKDDVFVSDTNPRAAVNRNAQNHALNTKPR